MIGMKTIATILACFLLTTFSYADEKPVFKPIIIGEKAPFSGVLMNYSAADKVARDKVKYKEALEEMIIKQGLWEFKEREYLKAIDSVKRKIKSMKDKGWFQRNKLWVGVAMGFVICGAMSYGVYRLLP